MENIQQFENRKKDHIRIALDDKTEATAQNRLSQIRLTHNALPELNLHEVETQTSFAGGQKVQPLFISSMTAGHREGEHLNLTLAQAAAERNWLMGVGSQRRQLQDESAQREWQEIRQQVPNVQLLGNIGLSQIIDHSPDKIALLAESLGAVAMIVHTNPLQESFQPEGTPTFKGGKEALKHLCQALNIPVILKETGCGFSKETLLELGSVGLFAVDVAGLGGTHWGRVEGERSPQDSLFHQAATTFKDWGIDTVESVINAVAVKNELQQPFQVWASGGVRNGLDAAKLIAMGSDFVGFAKPMMAAALKGKKALVEHMELLEYELKVALFCTGCKTISELKSNKVWTWST